MPKIEKLKFPRNIVFLLIPTTTMPRKQEDNNGSPSEREEAKDDSADSGNEDSSFSQDPESECKRVLVLTI